MESPTQPRRLCMTSSNWMDPQRLAVRLMHCRSASRFPTLAVCRNGGGHAQHGAVAVDTWRSNISPIGAPPEALWKQTWPTARSFSNLSTNRTCLVIVCTREGGRRRIRRCAFRYTCAVKLHVFWESRFFLQLAQMEAPDIMQTKN